MDASECETGSQNDPVGIQTAPSPLRLLFVSIHECTSLSPSLGADRIPSSAIISRMGGRAIMLGMKRHGLDTYQEWPRSYGRFHDNVRWGGRRELSYFFPIQVIEQMSRRRGSRPEVQYNRKTLVSSPFSDLAKDGDEKCCQSSSVRKDLSKRSTVCLA